MANFDTSDAFPDNELMLGVDVTLDTGVIDGQLGPLVLQIEDGIERVPQSGGDADLLTSLVHLGADLDVVDPDTGGTSPGLLTALPPSTRPV